MKRIRWFKCPVIGTGKVTGEKDDSYRPAIADLPFLQDVEWSAVYYPKNPPYKFCVVRVVVEKEIPTPSEAEEFDVKGLKKFCDELPYFKYRWLDQPVYPAKPTSSKSSFTDPVETRYFRSDEHTVNTVTGKKLLTSRSGVSEYWGTTKSGATMNRASYQGLYLQRVQQDGTTTTIAATWATTERTSNGQGIQSATKGCPQTDLETTDAIRTMMRILLRYNTTTIGVNSPYYWITEQLGATQLNAKTWTFYRYSYVSGLGTSTATARIYYDSSTYNTRITNFSYTKPVAYYKTLIETLGLADTFSRTWTAHKTYSETLGLVDTVSAFKVFYQTLSELLGLSDVVVKSPSIVKAESLGLLDTYSRTWTAYKTYSELLGLADSLQKEPSKAFPEVLGLSDTVTKSPSITRSELLGLKDTYSRTWNVYRTHTELLGLADSISKSTTIPLTEALGILDSLVKSASVTRTELLGLKDTVQKGVVLHPLTELLGLVDSIQKEPFKILSETLGLKDVYSRVLSIQRVFTETLGLKDYVSKHTKLHDLAEVLGLLDRTYRVINPIDAVAVIRKLIRLEEIER